MTHSHYPHAKKRTYSFVLLQMVSGMPHKAFFNGTAYEIKGGKTQVGGTEYSITNGRVLADGTGYNISFATPVSNLVVGDSVFMRVNGALKEFIVVHKGNPSTSMYDTSCNGVWVVMKDIYTTGEWKSSGNKYPESTVHAYLNGTFLGLIDSAAQTAIKQIKIPYACYYSSTMTLYKKSSGLSAKVFLLSPAEMGCTTYPAGSDIYEIGYHVPTDGAKLSYFSTGETSAALKKRIAYSGGTASAWWTRSPWDNNSTANAVFMNSSGYNNYDKVYKAYGYRPALILDINAILDPQTHEVIGLH